MFRVPEIFPRLVRVPQEHIFFDEPAVASKESRNRASRISDWRQLTLDFRIGDSGKGLLRRSRPAPRMALQKSSANRLGLPRGVLRD
jgi:hypothetical protein